MRHRVQASAPRRSANSVDFRETGMFGQTYTHPATALQGYIFHHEDHEEHEEAGCTENEPICE